MRKHILCGLQLRCSKMRFPCHGRNLQCAVLHFSGYKLQVSRRMLHRSYAFPRAITKNILFCFEAAGLQSISSAPESGLCLRMTKTSTSGGKKVWKALEKSPVPSYGWTPNCFQVSSSQCTVTLPPEVICVDAGVAGGRSEAGMGWSNQDREHTPSSRLCVSDRPTLMNRP